MQQLLLFIHSEICTRTETGEISSGTLFFGSTFI